MRKPASLLLLALAAALLSAPTARAHLSATVSRTVDSSSHKYVLVLVRPKVDQVEPPEDYDPAIYAYLGLTPDEIQDWHDGVQAQLALEAKYLESGLYRNDGSTEPLWTIEYLPTCKDIFVANDGSHVVSAYVEWDNWGPSERGDALDFYKNGELIADYREETLLRGFGFKFIIARCLGLRTPVCTTMKFDDATGHVDIQTNQNESFRFSLATGDVLSHSSPWPFYVVIPLVVIPAPLLWSRRPWRATTEGSPTNRSLRFSIRDLFALAVIVAALSAMIKLNLVVGLAVAAIVLLGAIAALLPSRIPRTVIYALILFAYGAFAAIVVGAAVDIAIREFRPQFSYWWWWAEGYCGVAFLVYVVAVALFTARRAIPLAADPHLAPPLAAGVPLKTAGKRTDFEVLS